MTQDPSPQPQQNFTVEQSSLSGNNQLGVHVGRDNLQAGRDNLQAGQDILQHQGSGNIFKDVMINVFQGQAQPTAGGMTRQEYRNRQALLDKVENYWIKGVLEQSLQWRSPIPLNLDLQPHAVVAPWQVVDQALDAQPRMLPASTQVIDVFDELGTGRSLLILGEPGSGKTTTLLTLARVLLARCRQDSTHLIPVVFNLSSWTCRKQSISDWLIEELNGKYQVPKPLGKTWVEGQNLLFLLDGLDEVQSDQREACVHALNAFHQDFGPELVVCCRARNYSLLKERLNFQAAVCLRSLTNDQILASIQHANDNLQGLRILLEKDADLRDLASSPLMLTIMATAYEQLDDQAFLDTGLLEKKRARLFDAYIDSMFGRRGMTEHYLRSSVVRWLSWLAETMRRRSQTVFMIEDLHPDWLQEPVHQRLYRIGVKMLFTALWGALHLGLIGALLSDGDPSTIDLAHGAFSALLGLGGGIAYSIIGGLLGGFVHNDTKFRDGSIINGLIMGGIFGPLFGLAMLHKGADTALPYSIAYGFVYFAIGIYIYGLIHEVKGFQPIDNLRWSVRKALRYLPLSMIMAIALKFGTSVGIWISLIVGLFFLIIIGFENAKNIDQRTVPNYKIRRSVANAGKLFLILAPLSGLTFYIAHDWSIYSAIANGLIFGVGAALMGAGGAGLNGIKHLVLRVIFWTRNDMPWNYARFLDDACDRIFLQRVGGGYVFIHRSLLEHFATKF